MVTNNNWSCSIYIFCMSTISSYIYVSFVCYANITICYNSSSTSSSISYITFRICISSAIRISWFSIFSCWNECWIITFISSARYSDIRSTIYNNITSIVFTYSAYCLCIITIYCWLEIPNIVISGILSFNIYVSIMVYTYNIMTFIISTITYSE